MNITLSQNVLDIKHIMKCPLQTKLNKYSYKHRPSAKPHSTERVVSSVRTRGRERRKKGKYA